MGLRTVLNKSVHSNKKTQIINIFLILWRKKSVLKYTFVFFIKKMFHNENVIIIR